MRSLSAGAFWSLISLTLIWMFFSKTEAKGRPNDGEVGIVFLSKFSLLISRLCYKVSCFGRHTVSLKSWFLRTSGRLRVMIDRFWELIVLLLAPIGRFLQELKISSSI